MRRANWILFALIIFCGPGATSVSFAVFRWWSTRRDPRGIYAPAHFTCVLATRAAVIGDSVPLAALNVQALLGSESGDH